MLNDLIHWPLVALSIVGVVLNIRRRKECFIVWAFTNATWAAVDFGYGLYSQATLQLVYFGLALYGLREWMKH